VLVQQESEIGGRPMGCLDGQEHLSVASPSSIGENSASTLGRNFLE